MCGNDQLTRAGMASGGAELGTVAGGTVAGGTTVGGTTIADAGRSALVPADAAQALAFAQAGLEFLAIADPAGLTGDERAALLRGLAACESVHLAAKSAVLAGFDRAGDHLADGQPTSRTWLRWQVRITRAAAGAAMAWSRRLHAHPAVAAALAAARISPSWARHITDWTDQLPEDARDEADRILLAAAAGGADLADLAALAEQIRARTAPPDSDHGDGGFSDRRLRLTPHFNGNARLDGDLTPPAAAAVRAMLDSLNGRTGPEDVRSAAQRDHDALAEASRRLIAGGLPDRAGQPTQIQLHMTLSQLLGQPEADQAAAAWIAANGTPAPPGADCDAAITPIVTGRPDPGILDQLAAILLNTSGATNGTGASRGSGASRTGTQTGQPDPASGGVTGTGWTGDGAERSGQMTISAARQLAIARAARLLSGPGGLVSWLRTSQLAGPAAAVSLPLDIAATTDTIPVHLRRAITRRDQHCRFPGCQQPPAACHVHHLIPRSEVGPTSLQNCLLLCSFHHLTAIHRWGWHLTLNPDGTTTATSPDHQRTLHSHAPPIAA